MKKYIIPTTDCVDFLASNLMQVFEGSGGGIATNPNDPNPSMGLAPSRPWAF